jgi:hypothetical protein
VSGCASIPKAQAGDSVGVNVLGRALQLGENAQIVTGISGVWMVDFQQCGLVALND